MPVPEPRDRLIVALDVPTAAEARGLAEAIGDACRFYKIGHQLLYTGGEALARTLIAEGARLFIDAKLLDIPQTVAAGTQSIAALGAHFLTVHAYPHALAAAQRGAAGSTLGILGVTVLTSLDDADLAEIGYALPVRALVARRVRAALDAGIAGVVASAAEAALVREIAGTALTIVTPGIRRAGDAAGDQKRVATPQSAIAAGADLLVVGRPITGATHPRDAARRFQDEIAKACEAR